MPAQRYRVVGSYSLWPDPRALEPNLAEVDATVRAGVPQGAVNVVGQVVAFNDPFTPRQPWDLSVFDEQGRVALRFVEGVPKEGV